MHPKPTPTLAIGQKPSDVDQDVKEKALFFRAKRQQLLVSNIANADTPGYKAQDISFQESLKAAVNQAGATSMAASTTNAGHVPVVSTAHVSTFSLAHQLRPIQNSLDGNTVDMDRERGEIAKNAILYQLAASSLDDEGKEFLQAISDPSGGRAPGGRR